MRVVRSLERARGAFDASVVTIGNFDGVHRGHQVIVRELVDDARQRGADAVVLTFEPHPVAVLRPDAAPRMLMPLRDRLAALAELGCDAVVVQPFSERFSQVEAPDFVERFLVGSLAAQKILVGHDINFGKGRAGTPETLIEAGQRYGFAVEIIGPVDVDGIVVHSNVVRRAVADGDVALAGRLLGRPHRVRGRVVHGAGRGGGLGFKTANLKPRTDAVPPEGVYATVATVADRSVDSVTSIGHTPTFGGSETVIEAHLLDDAGDLYGRPMALDFIDFVRGQKKFSGPEELVEQITRDVATARERLEAFHRHGTE